MDDVDVSPGNHCTDLIVALVVTRHGPDAVRPLHVEGGGQDALLGLLQARVLIPGVGCRI